MDTFGSARVTNGPQKRFWLVVVAVLIAGAATFDRTTAPTAGAGRARIHADSTAAADRIARPGLPFVANAGQVDPRVAYYAPTFAGVVFVTRDGELVYDLPARLDAASSATARDRRAATPGGWSLTESFVGGAARPVGGAPAAAKVSYFIGDDPGRWRRRLPTHERLGLGEVWPGIRVDLQIHGRDVEKIFTVQPGADVSAIRVRIDGAQRLAVADNGSLALATGVGEVTLSAPIAWQERRGSRIPVAVDYTLTAGEYGFTLGAHDPALPVVIDPILQSSYLGGSGDEHPAAMILHPTTGEAYIAGFTTSIDFPGTAGGAQPAFAGGTTDAFLARLSADLTTLLQATYLGGASSEERVQSLLIHPGTGEVYATGVSFSNDFPGTAGGVQPVFAGGLSDAFVARLSGDLTALNQATYLGGGRDDAGRSIALHPVSGEIYVGGNTDSIDFPATAGGAQPNNSAPGIGNEEIFVARLNAALTAINQATYYGSFGTEEMSNSLAIHPATGEIYVAGQTDLSTALPGTAGGAQPASGGSQDAFVARFDDTLTTLGQATYLGGSDIEGIDTYVAGDGIGRSLIIHPGSGEIYVAGHTFSADFPGTAGGAQATRRGTEDGFIARLDAGLTTLNQATYVGGLNGDNISSLALHPLNGEIYAAGVTVFSAFAETAGGAQSVYGGGTNDGFVARFNAGLTAINQATYLGGSGNDFGGAGLAIHATSGEVYVTARTPSTDFPVTAGGAQPAGGGGLDGSVTRITADLQAVTPTADLAIAIGDAPDPLFTGANITYTITVTNAGPSPATGITVTDVLPAGLSFVSATPSQGGCSGTATVTCALGGLANGASATVTIVVTANTAGTATNTVTVTAVETDPVPGDNSATATTTVNAATTADLALSLSAAPNPVGINTVLSYSHTVTNNGPLAASNVVLTHNLPVGGFVFGAASPSQGGCSGTVTVTCTLGAIANGASATVVITVTPNAVGTLASTATLGATEPDPNAADNSAAANVSVVQTVCSQSTGTSISSSPAATGSTGCTAGVGAGRSGGGAVGPWGLLALLLAASFRGRCRTSVRERHP